MDEATKKRALEILTDIGADIEGSVVKWEGQPFNGRNVSTMFGELSAAVVGLTGVVRKLVEEG